MRCFLFKARFFTTVNINTERRKPWGDGGHIPQNLEWGTPMYNVPPDFDIFSLFSLIQSVSERYFI